MYWLAGIRASGASNKFSAEVVFCFRFVFNCNAVALLSCRWNKTAAGRIETCLLTKKCGRYAGPLKSSHLVFALDEFQEIQLLARNLSKSWTQQHLAEHLKTTASPITFLLCFSWKDCENSLHSRARRAVSTTIRKRNPHCRAVPRILGFSLLPGSSTFQQYSF